MLDIISIAILIIMILITIFIYLIILGSNLNKTKEDRDLEDKEQQEIICKYAEKQFFIDPLQTLHHKDAVVRYSQRLLHNEEVKG